jgi:transcriptional regulator with XRE-family HTH domain
MARPSPKHSGLPALRALGDAIRMARIERGLSQEALAVDVGLDRSYVGGIERGEHNITLVNLLRIAETLNLKGSELLGAAGI